MLDRESERSETGNDLSAPSHLGKTARNMDLPRLIDGLPRPADDPSPAADWWVIQTHISVVSLSGEFAHMLHKPVPLGFIGLMTLDRRCHDCREEVRQSQVATDAGAEPATGRAGGRLREDRLIA
jgi:hypothetical protein